MPEIKSTVMTDEATTLGAKSPSRALESGMKIGAELAFNADRLNFAWKRGSVFSAFVLDVLNFAADRLGEGLEGLHTSANAGAGSLVALVEELLEVAFEGRDEVLQLVVTAGRGGRDGIVAG